MELVQRERDLHQQTVVALYFLQQDCRVAVKQALRAYLQDLFVEVTPLDLIRDLVLEKLDQVKDDFLWTVARAALTLPRLHIEDGVENLGALVAKVGDIGVSVHAEDFRTVLVGHRFDVISNLLNLVMNRHEVDSAPAELVVGNVDHLRRLEDF